MAFNPSAFLVGAIWTHYNYDRFQNNPKVLI